MAGAGYKLFNTGDVLTAQQVNEYLQQQVTMVFANATARTTALSGVLAEGMMSYLQDTNAVEVYDGSSWVSVGNIGDITGVTAGTGLTGGGTSGTVTLTNDMATTITTKGDLLVGTGSATYARLGVGTNGHTLVADSTETTGLKWQAPAGGGKVLQVVSATTSTQTESTSTTYADTTLTATITPSSASSTILVLVHQTGITKWNSATEIFLRLMRGSTQILEFEKFAGYTGTTSYNSVGGSGCSYKDSPATTSATTYKTQFKTGSSGQSVYVQMGSGHSSITLLEIGA
jgi:hypothetical protein